MRQIKISIFSLIILVAFLGSSCKKESAAPDLEHFVSLNITQAKLAVGSQRTVQPLFDDGVDPKRDYQWTSSDPAVAEVVMNDDLSATITGKAPGQTNITFASSDNSVFAVATITVTDQLPVYRILAIGNSFSEDALEAHLSGLAQAAGQDAIIGNLYIGGASLEQHLANAQGNQASYDFRRIDEKGNRTTQPNTSIETALLAEPWDFISIQQASPFSGQFETYEAFIPSLLNYIKSKATNPNAKFIFHQTWAYAPNSTHDGFANYGNDQMTMYNAIVGATSKVQDQFGFDLVVPSGTAIQNGRTSVLGEQFTRDGYHLDENLGKYTAAATWFEALFGQDVLPNLYKPQNLSSFEAEIAKQAARFAVASPFAITDMIDYKGGFGILKDPVYIAFGMDEAVSGWNGFVGESGVGTNSSIADLKDAKGYNTRLSLLVTAEFNGRNNSGERNTTTDFEMPPGVSGNSYYGNAGAAWLGKEIKQSSLKISGLNKDRQYDFCFFGSRAGVGDNRETLFIVKGANEESAAQNTSSNRDKTVCVENVRPNNNGEIFITITAGPNNNNGNKFFYLNAMRITAGD